MPIIEKAKNKYFVAAFEQFGHITAPDQSEGDLKVSAIRVDLSNGSPDNLKVSFNKAANSIGFSISQTHLEVNTNWEYHKSFVKIGGSAKVTGTLGAIGMDIVMAKAAEGSYFIPQIGVNNFNLNLDKGAFNLEFRCDHCPGEVEKLISNFMKDKLLDAVKNAINSQTPSQVTSIGNHVLMTSYPRAVTLYNNIDIATALIGEVVVQDDHIQVPLDATFFLHSKGYNRPGPAPEIPTYNPQNPGDIQLFMSPYLLSTLGSTLNLGVQSYKVNLYGYDIVVQVDPSQGSSSFNFEDQDFSANLNPLISIPSFGVGLQIGASAKIDPKIQNGDGTNMLFVTPRIKSISLSSLKIMIGPMPIDVSFVVDYLNEVFKVALNMGLIPSVAIAKLAILPLHVTNSKLDFHKDYSEFGVLFDFGL